MSAYCLATYRSFDEKADFHKKATSIAVGLTVGSWTELPEAQKTQMEKHLGKVISVDVHEPAPGQGLSERYADIQIAYPDVNFSRDIPALLVTVFGKLSMDGKIKLIDLSFSSDFLAGFAGPKFGMQGVRDLLDVHNRPLLMSIFKSVVGYELPALREQFYLQAAGGVDLIKDDEILFENPLTPLEKRIEVCLEAAEQARKETGQKLLYAVNLTGPTFELAEQAKKAIRAGANALLFNVLAYGFDVLHALSADPEINIPIMAHPAMAGATYPSHHYGISASVLLGKLMRIAGADLVLFPSPYGSVVMPRDENLAIKHALLTSDLRADYAYGASTDAALNLAASFPVPSAGIHPGLVPLILRDFGGDVVVNAGGGIHGHPLGTIAGGQAFRQAIDASLQGITLQEYAKTHPELQAAIDTWGNKE
ncbi:2,3-diketo-5-methylthiopentyl-1-phosphate enolase [Paenibacillus sp. SYP-B3998]|uniref:2,3-diketo-5-methylthiopentyl-1-phosphate enolase n=1 Tax=Paenibacillus sp. SYP-B3998 TaxID=2678564 RepID=A0A6G3ZUY7_9BACL|nr:2,3-diketo-5-methylthiopentyl-1-phosphate enolase [Paenibacillus sp. SYP-B3998]NEW06023.1 2,3-diketo-5-methylthiopentyl-1-phosphate enolase [Paenibacillus sp. SYP-B3998]